MAFSDLAHSQLRSLYGLSASDIMHVTLDTRPSGFSACNIEKLGVAWGRGYMQDTRMATIKVNSAMFYS